MDRFLTRCDRLLLFITSKGNDLRGAGIGSDRTCVSGATRARPTFSRESPCNPGLALQWKRSSPSGGGRFVVLGRSGPGGPGGQGGPAAFGPIALVARNPSAWPTIGQGAVPGGSSVRTAYGCPGSGDGGLSELTRRQRMAENTGLWCEYAIGMFVVRDPAVAFRVEPATRRGGPVGARRPRPAPWPAPLPPRTPPKEPECRVSTSACPRRWRSPGPAPPV